MRRRVVLRILCLTAALLLITQPSCAQEAPACMYAYSGMGTVTLYDAETGEAAAIIADGTLVFILEQNEGMALAQCASGTGWAAMEFLTLSLPQDDTAPVSAPDIQAVDDMENIVSLGIAYSRVRRGDAIVSLPTASLSLPVDAPQGKELADIYAPREGKAALREKPSKKARSLGPLTAGIIVAVLEYGTDFCHVSTGNLTGYVLTSSLRFHPLAAPEDASARSAVLAYNGRTTGKTTIGLRLDPKNGSIRPAEFKTGTAVTALGEENGWVRVDVRGRHGYVPAKYILYTD